MLPCSRSVILLCVPLDYRHDQRSEGDGNFFHDFLQTWIGPADAGPSERSASVEQSAAAEIESERKHGHRKDQDEQDGADRFPKGFKEAFHEPTIAIAVS